MASVVLSQEWGNADLLGSCLVIQCEEPGTEMLELWTKAVMLAACSRQWYPGKPQPGWTGHRAAGLEEQPFGRYPAASPTGFTGNQPWSI